MYISAEDGLEGAATINVGKIRSVINIGIKFFLCVRICFFLQITSKDQDVLDWILMGSEMLFLIGRGNKN